MKKRFAVLTALTACAVMLGASASFAGPGQWQQNDKGWWWQRDDGTWPAGEWKWVDGNGDGFAEYYHFNESGYMDHDFWVDGYYVNPDGAWTTGGTVVTVTTGIDEWKSSPVQIETAPSVDMELIGNYEMHTEMVDSSIIIYPGMDDIVWLDFAKFGTHEDGSSANEAYLFTLQHVGGGHYVADEATHSGDLLTFDWTKGSNRLSNVVLNGQFLSHYELKP